MVEERKYSRSVSQLKSWTKCGEAFYLERIRRKDLPVRPAVWTIMGVAVHDTIQEWEKSDRTLDYIDKFLYHYEELVKQSWIDQPDPKLWFLPPNTRYVQKAIDSYRERGKEQLAKYTQSMEESQHEVISVEEPFELTLDGVQVRGQIDQIIFFPGSDLYVVRDVKTGTPKEEEDYRQLGLYAFAARFLWGMPVDEGEYWFTKVNRASPTYNLTKFGAAYWTEQFRLLDSAISQEIYLPSPGSNCSLCSVKPWCRSQGWLKIGEDL